MRTAQPPAAAERDENAGERRRPGRLLGGVVVGAGVVAVAGWLLAQPDPSQPQPTTRVSSAPAALPATVGEPADPTVAAPAAVPAPAVPDQAVPTAPPPDVTWELFRGVALPTSPVHGPTRIDGPVHSGYARTPYGALVAATQIEARRLLSSDAEWRLVVDQQLFPGPGREAFSNLRETVTSDTPPSAGYAQIAAFRFVTYSKDLAVVSLANKTSAGSIHVGNLTVRWEGGDWRLEVPVTGLSQPQTVQSLAGFVPWQGVAS